MKQQSFEFPSATGVCTISAEAWIPDGEPEAVLVIHHGMAEHLFGSCVTAGLRFICMIWRATENPENPENRRGGSAKRTDGGNWWRTTGHWSCALLRNIPERN